MHLVLPFRFDAILDPICIDFSIDIIAHKISQKQVKILKSWLDWVNKGILYFAIVHFI